MDYKKYLQDLIFSNATYSLTGEDKKIIKFEGIEIFIARKLSSSKFRSNKLPQELVEKIKEKTHYCVSNSLPIHISVPFGGFKKWQLPSYPEVDWAEVFNIVQLVEWLKPIAAAYEKGVILDYYSDEVFISRMNNIPQSDLDLYNNQFEKLLKLFQKNLPSNFILKFSKIRDQISQEELLKRFDKAIAKLRKEWDSLPEQTQKERLAKTERNYKYDFTGLAEAEKLEKLLESTLVHDAFIFDPDWEQGVPWAFDVDMIPVGFRYTKTWGLPMKSSASSAVQFWIGYGVLKEASSSFVPSILTYEQYKKYKDDLEYYDLGLFAKEYTQLSRIPILKS